MNVGCLVPRGTIRRRSNGECGLLANLKGVRCMYSTVCRGSCQGDVKRNTELEINKRKTKEHRTKGKQTLRANFDSVGYGFAVLAEATISPIDAQPPP